MPGTGVADDSMESQLRGDIEQSCWAARREYNQALPELKFD